MDVKYRENKMRALLLILAIFGGYQYYINRPVVVTQLKYGDVVLYATDWCGYCKKVRRFFAIHRIPYVEYNIDRNNDAKKELISLSGGTSVPVVEIRGDVIRGFNETQLRKKFGINQ